MVWEVFKNIQYDVYYKAVFVLFSVIFILSLFLDTKVIPNNKIQFLSIVSIVYSLSAWFVNGLLGIWQMQLNELRGKIELDYLGALKKITTGYVLGFIIYWVIFFLVLLFY